MSNLNLGQDVANKINKIDNCSYCGQTLFPYSIVTVLLLTSTPLMLSSLTSNENDIPERLPHFIFSTWLQQ